MVRGRTLTKIWKRARTGGRGRGKPPKSEAPSRKFDNCVHGKTDTVLCEVVHRVPDQRGQQFATVSRKKARKQRYPVLHKMETEDKKKNPESSKSVQLRKMLLTYVLLKAA